MRDELIVEKIINAIKALDEIDEMISTQSTELSRISSILSDLEHLIEKQTLSKEQAKKIIDEMHYYRCIRRSLKREYEIEKTYKDHSNKMMGNNTRQFIVSEIQKTVKNLNSENKNRVLTTEEIESLLEETPHKKRGRPPKIKKEEVE